MNQSTIPVEMEPLINLIVNGIIPLFTIMFLIPSIIMIVSQWIIFKKAGKKGWEAIVPIYNFIVLIQITELPMWYIALFFVPFANIYAMFKIYIELAHKFGKSTGFGVLTVFFSFICLPILAFGKNNVYQGNGNQNIQNNNFQSNNMNTYQNNNMPNNINNTSMQQPFAFDQNINTNINNIQEPTIANNFNQPINPIPQPPTNQTPMFNQPTPIVNQEPIVNTTPNLSPLTENQPQFEPTNNINNINNLTPPMTENIQKPIMNQEPPFTQTPPIINQQPVNNDVITNNTQPLNVIPNMAHPQEPMMPNQNNNNQNM